MNEIMAPRSGLLDIGARYCFGQLKNKNTGLIGSSKTATIHKIAQWVSKKQIRYDQADIHNIGNEVGFMDLIQSPEYADRTHFFVLMQSAMWEYVFGIYGVKGEQKVVTVDNKVHVALISRIDAPIY